jgi:hypothetical protein
MNTFQKLKIRPEGKAAVLLVNCPKECAPLFEEVPPEIKLSARPGKGPYAAFIAFAPDSAGFAAAMEKTRVFFNDTPIIYFCYPKKGSKRYKSDLTKDSGWETLERFGLTASAQVSLDEDWYALRFTRPE